MKKLLSIITTTLLLAIPALAVEKLMNSTGVVINPATSDAQTDGTQKTRLTDGTTSVDVMQADNKNGLVVIAPGHLSTLNSTTATLASGATWTGQAEEATNHGVIQVIVKASHASATNGFVAEYSPDGTNWDSDDSYTIAADTGKVYSFQPAARYFRIRYTNGASAQTYFRLQTTMKPYYVKPSSHRVGDSISANDDAELVKAVLAAEMPSGSYTPINATAAGNLKSAIEEAEPTVHIGINDATATRINPATSDNQTNGIQKTQVVDSLGSNIAIATEPTLTNIAASALSILANQTNGTQSTQIKSSSGTEALVGNWASTLGTSQTGLNVRALGYLFNGSQIERSPGDGTYGAKVNVTLLPSPYNYEVAAGNVSGAWSVFKFGSAPMGVQTSLTDIWDRADSTPTQQIWLAPTAARVHGIVSTSADDDGSPAGLGARTITVYGLTSWSAAAETSETITTNGTTTVNTVNSYVIIHRMKTATSGTSGPNVGTITATAATDNTVTAVILPGNGRTEMAIYGIPSTKSLYLDNWCVNIDRTVAASTSVDFRLAINETPATNTVSFVRSDDQSLQTGSTTQHCKPFPTPLRIQGPAIIKIQGIASAADIDCEASFNGIVK